VHHHHHRRQPNSPCTTEFDFNARSECFWQNRPPVLPCASARQLYRRAIALPRHARVETVCCYPCRGRVCCGNTFEWTASIKNMRLHESVLTGCARFAATPNDLQAGEVQTAPFSIEPNNKGEQRPKMHNTRRSLLIAVVTNVWLLPGTLPQNRNSTLAIWWPSCHRFIFALRSMVLRWRGSGVKKSHVHFPSIRSRHFTNTRFVCRDHYELCGNYRTDL
jgi:hypothetical protein